MGDNPVFHYLLIVELYLRISPIIFIFKYLIKKIFKIQIL